MESKLSAGAQKGRLSGMALKWIAVASMVIDHFGSIVMDGVTAPYMNAEGAVYFTADMPFFMKNAPFIKEGCEVVGSIAFPIFCFLIVQGFLHTRNRTKYGLLVLGFALISEIPYNVAHYQTLLHPSLQNVMFTLAVSIFTLMAIAFFEGRFSAAPLKKWCFIALSVLAGCGVAFLIRGEYVFLGVLTASLMYLLRANKYLQLCGIAPLMVVSPWVLLALPPLSCYNGQRGKGSKYFFYVFYPAHFLAFAGIAYLLSARSV